MLKVINNFEIKSNWISQNNNNELISYISIYNNQEETESTNKIEEIILIPSNDILFNSTSSNEQQHCIIQIKCPNLHLVDKSLIEAIDIICDARHMEFYTLSNEYITTVKGIRIDEELNYENVTYILQHSFDVSICGFIVKFIFPEKANRLRLKKIYLTICHDTKNISNICNNLENFNGYNVDVGKVKELLGDEKLSKGAQKLFKTIEDKFNKKDQFNKNASMNTLISLFIDKLNTTNGLSNFFANESAFQIVPENNTNDHHLITNSNSSSILINTQEQIKPEKILHNITENTKSSITDTNIDLIIMLFKQELNIMENRLRTTLNKTILESEQKIMHKLENLERNIKLRMDEKI